MSLSNLLLILIASAALLATVSTPATGAPSRPIALHPENPHYFLFRGKPTVLITSAEHYGAVLNQDFDHAPYLDELKAHKLNLTRIFTGAYVEPPGAFNIRNNTLAPAQGRFICPWARSQAQGYAGGGARFDLQRWDDAYFKRLRDFVKQAGKRGIVVEVSLFCPYYEEPQWSISPLKISNNVNGVGDAPRTEVLTLRRPALLNVQEAMVRKIVAELDGVDNIYFEICNEPYFGGVTLEWQRWVSGIIVDAEKKLPADQRHLIAQNISNGSEKVESPDPNVSLFNFHYSSPPDSVSLNYGLNKAIGFDETGFKKTHDLPYRTEGWDFIIAGGALYNNLDYSFSTATPDGSGKVTDPTPGGGGLALRSQLRILRDFIDGLPFLRMRPDNGIVAGGVPKGATARALGEPGKAYAIYVKGGTSARLSLRLPPGRYRAEWVDTRTGAVTKTERIAVASGDATLESPPYTEDIALRILAR